MQPSPFEHLPRPIARALEERGFTELTDVQQAVLAPALAGRSLRISSRTGSGKTVAIALVLARELAQPHDEPVEPAATARPAALVVAPTRELATQVAGELSWVLGPTGATVVVVTGGTYVREERRALRDGATVVVGTPGRLRDHLESGAVDPSAVRTVVLDEADQMLDLGFREDLEAILEKAPEPRRTHMASATFSRSVLALADRFQSDAVRVDAAGSGEAHDDIAHVAHLVRPEDRNAALVNLLLLGPDERTLVFVRTRADATAVADGLAGLGFAARALSGDMEQRERTQTLEAFRAGAVNILVATDVAARGLDVPEVGRVIHADPPGDADALTHRSGRTGRAGRKGTAVVLVPAGAREAVGRLYARARIRATWLPAPGEAEVRRAADERLQAELTAPGAEEPDARFVALADRVLQHAEPRKVVAALLAKLNRRGPCEPRAVVPLVPPAEAMRRNQALARDGRGARASLPAVRAASSPASAPARDEVRDARRARPVEGGFVPFWITWGARHGADPRRLLAVVCRRGGIAGQKVGAIRIGEASSTFEVSADVAHRFAEAARRPDPRDPRVRITRTASMPEREPMRPDARHTKPSRPDGGAARRRSAPPRTTSERAAGSGAAARGARKPKR